MSLGRSSVVPGLRVIPAITYVKLINEIREDKKFLFCYWKLSTGTQENNNMSLVLHITLKY